VQENGSPADSLFGQEDHPMLDEIQRLRSNPLLLQLLQHYASVGKETWQNRLMAMEGVSASELVKFHGELVAFGWADQNTGQVPCCYRITSTGIRAIQQVNGGGIDDGDVAAEVPEKTFPKFARKKREKRESVAVSLAVKPGETTLQDIHAPVAS
jgi:hypothetical protein